MCIRDSFCMVVVLDQQCAAKWLVFWDRCQNASAFDLSVHAGGNFAVLRHDEVCSPSYAADRCPRAVVEVLGNLLVQKLMFTIFVIPPLVLLISTEQLRRAREWIVQELLRKPEYKVTNSIDQQMVGVAMLIEYPLVLGFCVPALLPLSALALAHSAAVFHCATRHLNLEMSQARPSSAYMAMAWVLGCAMNAWFFLACGLYGGYLMAVGMPVSGGVAVWLMQRQSQQPESLSPPSELIVLPLKSGPEGWAPSELVDSLLAHESDEDSGQQSRKETLDC
eukprot:TRINITY_DN9156_c0_g1_i2.p1 TRINITY_DN9156_c0_g1~~TRINITY_DN9156_c0_g1_i2.p1  ORF type:complete len:279 (+),score=39.01 TRINITY_DN9156_c0_g1_i2:104-940(+)